MRYMQGEGCTSNYMCAVHLSPIWQSSNYFFIVSENQRSNFGFKSVVTAILSSAVICISSVLESLSTSFVCCIITVNT